MINNRSASISVSRFVADYILTQSKTLFDVDIPQTQWQYYATRLNAELQGGKPDPAILKHTVMRLATTGWEQLERLQQDRDVLTA